jgi:hypothetical protein
MPSDLGQSGDRVEPTEVRDRWHDEGTFTVKCEQCGRDFPTSCTGFVVCADCLNNEADRP